MNGISPKSVTKESSRKIAPPRWGRGGQLQGDCLLKKDYFDKMKPPEMGGFSQLFQKIIQQSKGHVNKRTDLLFHSVRTELHGDDHGAVRLVMPS